MKRSSFLSVVIFAVLVAVLISLVSCNSENAQANIRQVANPTDTNVVVDKPTNNKNVGKSNDVKVDTIAQQNKVLIEAVVPVVNDNQYRSLENEKNIDIIATDMEILTGVVTDLQNQVNTNSQNIAKNSNAINELRVKQDSMMNVVNKNSATIDSLQSNRPQ